MRDFTVFHRSVRIGFDLGFELGFDLVSSVGHRIGFASRIGPDLEPRLSLDPDLVAHPTSRNRLAVRSRRAHRTHARDPDPETPRTHRPPRPLTSGTAIDE